MKLKFVNINEAPIDEVNLLEEETFQYKKTLSKIDSEFLLKFEGLSMINQNYIGHIYASVSSDQADIISFLIKIHYLFLIDFSYIEMFLFLKDLLHQLVLR